MPGAPEPLPCPTCGRPVPIAVAERPASYPFCNSRCRLRDLGKWATGEHVIPGAPLTFDPYAEDLDHP